MKKVIHKSFFKRGTAILLALICLISAICLVPINAASREVTITFDYAYDTGGNIIGFVQYTEHDGYVVGTAGEELCTIQADGDDAYCIEPGHSLYSGNTLTTDASAAWNALSKAQKKAVNLALLFGKSGNGANLGGTEGQKWIATQLVVWEFCTGCRDASTFKLKNSKFIDGITAGDNNPGVKSNYNKIIAKLNDYNVIPSFAYETQANAKSNVKELKYSDGTMSVPYPSNLTIDTFYTNSEGYLITPEMLVYDKGYKLVEVQAPYGYVLDSTPVTFDITEDNATEENALTIVTESADDGSFSFGENNIPFGTWYIREIAQPTGFVLNDTVYPVTIGADGDMVEIEIVNEHIRGNVKTTKVDADYPENKLTGAVFEIYSDTNEDERLDKDDTLVGELKESDTGIYEMNDIVYGHYLVKEKTAPDGFILDENTYPVFIETDGTTYEVENEAGKGFLNEAMKGSLKIIKTSSDDKVEGISFRITSDNGFDQTVKTDPKEVAGKFVGMVINGFNFTEKAEAGQVLIESCKAKTTPEPTPLGEYRGFKMELAFDTFTREYEVKLKGHFTHSVSLGTDVYGNITRIDNAIDNLETRLNQAKADLENTKTQLETAKVEVEKPFAQEEELKQKMARLNELNALLNVDKRENEIVGGEPDEGEQPTKNRDRDCR